jgi:hypothetical protein
LTRRRVRGVGVEDIIGMGGIGQGVGVRVRVGLVVGGGDIGGLIRRRMGVGRVSLVGGLDLSGMMGIVGLCLCDGWVCVDEVMDGLMLMS